MCNEKPFGIKKKENIVICVDELWEHCAKWNQPVRERQISHDSPFRWYLK